MFVHASRNKWEADLPPTQDVVSKAVPQETERRDGPPWQASSGFLAVYLAAASGQQGAGQSVHAHWPLAQVDMNPRKAP